MIRRWAFWRRFQYTAGLAVFLCIILGVVYKVYVYSPSTCFDEKQNGDEHGVDCGGACVRICPFDIMEPSELWVRSFKIRNGQYNAVAYIENRNINVGTSELGYTLGLYDTEGLITERIGTTILPPDGVYPIFEGRIETGARIPTRTTIELDEDAIWVPAEMGRDQFKVNGRELNGADTRPELIASLTNTSLEEASGVEIVTTIFDAKGTPLTASQTVVPRFAGRATEDVVFTWPTAIAKTVRTCEVPTDVVLGIDLSGSMNDDGGTPPEPISSVLKSAGAFVERLKNKDQIGVVTYATDASVRRVLTGEREQVASFVEALTIAPADERGSTNTGDALWRAKEEFASPRHNPDARKVFVLLSDGLANAPGEEPEQYALDAASAIKASDVEIFTIGLGEKVNDSFLKSIASNSGQYFKAASVGTVNSIYQKVSEAICEDGAAVIDIVPKTSASFAPLQ